MQIQADEEKMNRARFEKELCKAVTELLGEGYHTELSKVRKNNGVWKDVLYIRKENSECVPCFYMGEVYRSYLMGECIAGLAEHLTNIVLCECESVSRQAKQFLNQDWIVEHLFLRLVQTEDNAASLKDAVYVEFLDLAAVFYVLTEDGEDGVKSFQLPRSVWESFGLGTAEEYFPKIAENTRRLFPERLWCIEHTVSECRILGEESLRKVRLPQEELYSHKLYVLSNHRRINGAAVLLYPELLKCLGEKFEGNYYIIPSSVHEVLLLKDTKEEDEVRLNYMVCEVNEQQVEPEEVLSNHVYYYSVEEGVVQSRTKK